MISALVLGCAVGIVGDAAAETATPSAADLAAYQAARATIGRDADAHVMLALWCESRGMAAERTALLTRAVLLDPDNARARGLLGFVEHEGKWLRPEEVAKAVEDSPERQAVFQEYLQRRTKARDKADDLYKLALWCEEKGLTQQMTAHLHRVVELDPGRDGAWRRLGFKKVSGRWVNPEFEAAVQSEREAQNKADKLWGPKLEKLKAALSGRDKAKKAEAIEELATINDPRATPSIWRVFARGNEGSQRVAAEVLGRIEGSGASRALSMLAVFSPFPGVRGDAAQLLSRRDPREFAGLLAGLIRDEVKYKKKDVNGPGSQGELFVEGKEANVQRFYTPLRPPSSRDLMPGDQVRVDEFGMTYVERPLGGAHGPRTPTTSFVGTFPYFGAQPGFLGGLPQTGIFSSLPPGRIQTGAATIFQEAGLNPQLSQRVAEQLEPRRVDLTPTAGLNATPIYERSLRIPVGRMLAEADASARIAQQQLAQDVQRIEEHNAPIREINDRATAILRNVSGIDQGDDRGKWMEWVYDLNGYGFPQKYETPEPPTIYTDVPIAFQPQAAPFLTQRLVALANIGPSCFAGGTLVRALRGDRPIEEIEVGDQLLTQDTTTGKLEYRAVVAVFHNPPNWTYKINMGNEVVRPTGIHRFWKAGQGWIMARDVKAGDRLRTVGGTVEVVSAEKNEVEPVFNLLLEGGDNYFVGSTGLLAHDNGFVEPVAEPFDGVPALADLGTAAKP